LAGATITFAICFTAAGGKLGATLAIWLANLVIAAGDEGLDGILTEDAICLARLGGMDGATLVIAAVAFETGEGDLLGALAGATTLEATCLAKLGGIAGAILKISEEILFTVAGEGALAGALVGALDGATAGANTRWAICFAIEGEISGTILVSWFVILLIEAGDRAGDLEGDIVGDLEGVLVGDIVGALAGGALAGTNIGEIFLKFTCEAILWTMSGAKPGAIFKICELIFEAVDGETGLSANSTRSDSLEATDGANPGTVFFKYHSDKFGTDDTSSEILTFEAIFWTKDAGRPGATLFISVITRLYSAGDIGLSDSSMIEPIFSAADGDIPGAIFLRYQSSRFGAASDGEVLLFRFILLYYKKI